MLVTYKVERLEPPRRFGDMADGERGNHGD